MTISVRSWIPKGHFACKLGRRQQLRCLFINTFLTSSFSHLHNTKAWWWSSGLNKHAPVGILDPMPLLWLAQASQGDILAAYKVAMWPGSVWATGNALCSNTQEGNICWGYTCSEQKRCSSSWSSSDDTHVSPHFWQTHCLLWREYWEDGKQPTL